MATYLDFEKPIDDLESKIAELRHLQPGAVLLRVAEAIAAEHGGKGDSARAWLDSLAKAGRYQRDVY